MVRSIKIPEKRNERIRYTGRIAEKILERAVRIGRSVITVPAANATSVTMKVYKITWSTENSVCEIRKQNRETIMAGNVNTATWMSPK